MRVPLAQYLGMNRFVLDWLGGNRRFLPRPPIVRRVKRAVDPQLAEALNASNKHWGIFASDAIRR